MKKVAVIMGSDSDLKVMQGAIDMLRQFEVPFAVRVISAHRTPEAARDFAASAIENGFGAIICGAGKAAHLALMEAVKQGGPGLTVLPPLFVREENGAPSREYREIYGGIV